MKKLILPLLFLFVIIGTAQAGRKKNTVDYGVFDVSAMPAPIPWSVEASAICPYDDYDLQMAANYAFHYYNDLYWVAKSGYEEWGWDWNTTRNWLQREMYDRWQAENPGIDDAVFVLD